MDIQTVVGGVHFDTYAILDSALAEVEDDGASNGLVISLFWFIQMYFRWVKNIKSIDGYQQYLLLGQLVYAHKIDLCRATVDSERYEVISTLYNNSDAFPEYAEHLVDRYIRIIRQRVNGSVVFPVNIYNYTLNLVFGKKLYYNHWINDDEMCAYQCITTPSALATFIMHTAPTVQLRRPSQVDYNVNRSGKLSDLPIHSGNYSITDKQKKDILLTLNEIKTLKYALPVSYIQTLTLVNSGLFSLTAWCQPFYSSFIFERIAIHLLHNSFYFFSPQSQKLKQSPYDLDGLLISKDYYPGFDYSLLHGCFITNKINVMVQVVSNRFDRYNIENLDGLKNFITLNKTQKYEFGYENLYDYDDSIIQTVITPENYSWDASQNTIIFKNFNPSKI